MNIQENVENLKTFIDDKNHLKALNFSENIVDDLKEILSPHWSIQSEDEQYSDPEMWDYEPFYELSKKVFSLMCDIDRWFLEEEGYDDMDLDSFEEAKNLISDFIETELKN